MWSLTEEQRILQDTAQRLIDTEYTFEQRRGQITDATGYSRPLWDKLTELGLLALPFDEEVGGIGGGPTDLALLMQVFGRGLVVAPYVPTVVLGGRLIAEGADPLQRDELLGALVGGELQLAFAFAEPQARYDLEDTLTRASRQGETYVLNGRKSVVVNAPEADFIIVSARTAGEQRDTNGLSLFLVPRETPGLTISRYRLNDDHWAGDISLDGVEVNSDALLGTENDAWDLIESVVDAAIVASCAEALGAMDKIMEMAKEYLNTREQFGKLIGKNQALQFRMVEMFYQVEESRSMLAWAVRAIEGNSAERRAAVSATKVKVGEACRFIGQQGIQLHGAIGMTEEFPVGHYFKRLETLRLLFGDPDHHLARFGRWNRAQNQG